MRLVVCVNPVVEITKEYKISSDSSEITAESYILNPWDEFAIEAALQVKEILDTDVIALTAGNSSNDQVLRTALAMGCDQAFRIDLEQNISSGLVISKYLAFAIQQFKDIGLAFFGIQSIDFEYGITAFQTGSILGWSVISRLSKILKINDQQMEIQRSTNIGIEEISVPIPAIFTVNKNFAEPRFPSFLGRRKAAKANINQVEMNFASISESPPVPDIKYERRIRPKPANEILDPSTPDEMVSELLSKLKAAGL